MHFGPEFGVEFDGDLRFAHKISPDDLPRKKEEKEEEERKPESMPF